MDITLSLSGDQQPPGAPKSTQFELQIDAIWTQISPLGTLGTPAGSRRSLGSLQIDFCFNF